MKDKNLRAITFAVLAAALYALSSPISKLLLKEIPATMMASLLYLGAGIGMSLIKLLKPDKLSVLITGRNMADAKEPRQKLAKEDLRYIIGMVVLDIAAPILLMFGLSMTTSANASLLNNFEIVTTSLIAMFLFKETISRRLWLGIILITSASILLSFEDASSLSFSVGSVFVLSACVCWGLENNCTRKLSAKDACVIVIIKGIGSGLVSLFIAAVLKELSADMAYILAALLLGFVSYGLSIYFYICAQRFLGAAKTSAYYAISPFIGVLLSLIIFRELPSSGFLAALLIMIAGAYFAST